MALFREQNAAAFGALGGGEAIVVTDSSEQNRFEGGGKLCFESPPAQANYVNERYQKYSQPVEANSITVRVFLRILQREDDVAPITPEQERALFLQLLERTPVNDTSDRLQRPVAFDGQDQCYIDVRSLII